MRPLASPYVKLTCKCHEQSELLFSFRLPEQMNLYEDLRVLNFRKINRALRNIERTIEIEIAQNESIHQHQYLHLLTVGFIKEGLIQAVLNRF